MGLFDTIKVNLHCPKCGKNVQEIQTKMFNNLLEVYQIGDIIDGAPSGDVWIEEFCICGCTENLTWVERCTPVYLHLINTMLVDITSVPESDLISSVVKWMLLVQKQASLATQFRKCLKDIYWMIKNQNKIEDEKLINNIFVKIDSILTEEEKK